MIDKLYIRKYWFGVEKEDEIAEIVLLMERDRIEQYRAALDMTINQFQGVFKGITGLLNNQKISVIYSIGPAHIADCVNFLASSFPIKRFFSTGSIGGMKTEMGDILISNSCATQDACSSKLYPEKIINDPILGKIVTFEMKKRLTIFPATIQKIEKEFDCHILWGRIFTIPAVSLESEEVLQAIINQGYMAIDLETGPFLAACAYNNIEGSVIHWVTDLPLERNFYYQYYGDQDIIKQDSLKKHKQWLNMPKLILPILNDLLIK